MLEQGGTLSDLLTQKVRKLEGSEEFYKSLNLVGDGGIQQAFFLLSYFDPVSVN